MLSATIPSEAAYSRLITKLSESNILERVQETLLHQAALEGFITDGTVAIDATSIKSR